MTHNRIETLPEPAFARLREDFAGGLFFPHDEGFAEARAIWNGAIKRIPGLIARCTRTEDVVTLVRWALEHHVEVSVRAGGHGVAGNALNDGGLVIDLSQMKYIGVNRGNGRVKVQPGVLLGEMDTTTQTHGLAVPAGVISHTGVAGLTLGGGIGYLSRAHGLTSDNWIAAEVVTASGEVVRVDEKEHPDLFWGLQGAGANFGIVTSFELQAYSIGPDVLTGGVIYSADEARLVLEGYSAASANAPDELTTIVNLRWVPPAPWIPEHLHHREAIVLSGLYAGSIENGEKAFEPFRKLGTPLLDYVQSMPFTTHQRMYDGAVPHGLNYYWKSRYIRALDSNAITVLADGSWNASSRKSYTIVFQLGGAVSRRAPDSSAFEDRSAMFAPNINAVTADADSANPDVEWCRKQFDALESSSTGRAYVNFETETNPAEAYGSEKYARLTRLKREWDPENFFHMNQNIVPASGES